MVGWYGIGEEQGAVNRVGRLWIDGITAEEEDYEDKRIEPCVSKRYGFPAPEKAFCLSSF